MNFLNLFKHLLPTGRIFRLTVDKPLRRFFDGLSALPADIKLYMDMIFLDIDPQTTRELGLWEAQKNVTWGDLTEQERRDRLEEAWSAIGGQAPSYIQEKLRERGFDVYVHEWWEPGTEPAVGDHSCVTPRDPRDHLNSIGDFTAQAAITCGNDYAVCGYSESVCGAQGTKIGYPLVNKIKTTIIKYAAVCGGATAVCGGVDVVCGERVSDLVTDKPYIVPSDPAKWPYFFYVGGAVFGDAAVVLEDRRTELEELILKLKPAHLWAGVIVEYDSEITGVLFEDGEGVLFEDGEGVLYE